MPARRFCFFYLFPHAELAVLVSQVCDEWSGIFFPEGLLSKTMTDKELFRRDCILKEKCRKLYGLHLEGVEAPPEAELRLALHFIHSKGMTTFVDRVACEGWKKNRLIDVLDSPTFEGSYSKSEREKICEWMKKNYKDSFLFDKITDFAF